MRRLYWARGAAENLGERFGEPGAPPALRAGAPDETSSAASASRRCVSEQRTPLGPPCRRHGREWVAWAPKIRRGLSGRVSTALNDVAFLDQGAEIGRASC